MPFQQRRPEMEDCGLTMTASSYSTSVWSPTSIQVSPPSSDSSRTQPSQSFSVSYRCQKVTTVVAEGTKAGGSRVTSLPAGGAAVNQEWPGMAPNVWLPFVLCDQSSSLMVEA